ncbi:MAG TPA: hypothetical protein VM753_20440 [Anaeromyxobacter sp.]|jgi:hypothetical protein|nr:hypothetical protein [Anaeromyxobacter sp.]
MHVGIALVSLLATLVASFALASRRRRRARAVAGVLDLVAAPALLPAGLKHLGARLHEPVSLGLRIPNPHASSGAKRLGTLLPLR